jgi:arylformamidase
MTSPRRDHEWQYNPRVTTTGVEAYHHRAEAMSEDARRDHAGFIADVPYGPGNDEKVDIFSAGRGSPAHMFLHGGYWRGRDKRDYSFLAGAMNRRGISLIVANYSLCPVVRLADIVRQIERLLAALPGIAGDAGLDLDRLTASGHSAGAHLLAMALSSDGRSTHVPGRLRAATLISGIFELQPVLGITINDTIGLKADEVAGLSPMRLPLPLGIIYDIVVGGEESPGWIAQSALFAERCQTEGVSTDFLVAPAENHFSIMERFAEDDHPLAQRLCRLAERTTP